MYNLKYSIPLLFLVFTHSLFAQTSYFLNNIPNKTDAKPPSQLILTPNDFQAQVQKLQQQKKEQIANEINQNLSKTPPVKTPSIISKPLPPTTQTQTPSGTSTQTTTPTTSTTLPPPAVTETTVSPPPNMTPPPTTTTTITPPGTTTPTPTQAPPQSQPQVYTGFPTTPPSGNQQQQQPSSGGWNIKY